MLNKQADIVAWALLMYELEDAQDGLKSLCQEMSEGREFSEENFRIHMAHIYAHLNRAWHGRNATEEQHGNQTIWDEWAQFPTDLNPLAPAI